MPSRRVMRLIRVIRVIGVSSLSVYQIAGRHEGHGDDERFNPCLLPRPVQVLNLIGKVG
jgi:hypothetical protein